MNAARRENRREMRAMVQIRRRYLRKRERTPERSLPSPLSKTAHAPLPCYFCWACFFCRARRAASPSDVESLVMLVGLTAFVVIETFCGAGGAAGAFVCCTVVAGARVLAAGAAAGAACTACVGGCGWAISTETLSLAITLPASSGFSLSEVSSYVPC